MKLLGVVGKVFPACVALRLCNNVLLVEKLEKVLRFRKIDFFLVIFFD